MNASTVARIPRLRLFSGVLSAGFRRSWLAVRALVESLGPGLLSSLVPSPQLGAEGLFQPPAVSQAFVSDEAYLAISISYQQH